jgi:hypothetical protein
MYHFFALKDWCPPSFLPNTQPHHTPAPPPKGQPKHPNNHPNTAQQKITGHQSTTFSPFHVSPNPDRLILESFLCFIFFSFFRINRLILESFLYSIILSN